MDVFQYEMLHDMSTMQFGQDDSFELHDMDECDLIDKINRDIAIWRSHKELDERCVREEALEEDLVENPLPDPFEEDFMHPPTWHKAGDILEHKHPMFVEEDEGEVWDEEDDMGDFEIDLGEELPDFSPEMTEESAEPSESEESVEYDMLGEDEIFADKAGEKQDIPYVQHGELPEKEDNSGLVDDDEPVFFEEPV